MSPWLASPTEVQFSRDPVELAYLAGIIDGEGSIGVSRGRRPRIFEYDYFPYVSIANTSEDLLRWIAPRFPIGKACYRKSPPSAGGTMPVFSIRFEHRHLKQLLVALLPHLVIKRRHAELVLAFPRPSDTWKGLRDDGKRYNRSQLRKLGAIGHRTPAMYAEQERIWREFREINKAKGHTADRRSA